MQREKGALPQLGPIENWDIIGFLQKGGVWIGMDMGVLNCM